MTQIAAFFRVEGPLTNRPSWGASAFMIANAQTMTDRVTRLSGLAAALPFAFGGPIGDAGMATRLSWMGLRGMSEDRLAVLGEEYAERYLIPSLNKVGVELLNEARATKQRIVLVSENLDVIMKPLAEHLRVPELVCNRMEMNAGRATGRLVDPIVGGNLGGQWARAYAKEHGIDLEHSRAYGTSGDDAVLLSAVGKPCAVSPDRKLRNLARDNDWPVVES